MLANIALFFSNSSNLDADRKVGLDPLISRSVFKLTYNAAAPTARTRVVSAGLSARLAIQAMSSRRQHINSPNRFKPMGNAGVTQSALESYTWSPYQDQCGMLRPLGTSSADLW